VHRSNYAYQRHWEAYSNMQIMASKWVDAAMQVRRGGGLFWGGGQQCRCKGWGTAVGGRL
jgi:hypothetical protein